MAKKENDDDEEPELPLGELIKKFLEDQKGPIGDYIRQSALSMKRRGWELAGILIFLGGVFVGTGFLTYTGTISGEAFAFLIGIVLMYLFDLVRPRFKVGG